MGTVKRLGRVVTGTASRGALSWRSGTSAGQLWALAVLVAAVAASLVLSLWNYALMPITAYLAWLLVGSLVLRFWPLVAHTAVCLAAGLTAMLTDGPFTAARVSASAATVIVAVLVLVLARRQRSGLPGPIGDAMFADLRDRLQSMSRLPALPEGWSGETALRAAHDVAYAGDFLVAEVMGEESDDPHLEMILVDVCGKGVAAGTQALQFAGALGGLLGALPPEQLMGAANEFLLRQRDIETFATAVHVRVGLATGDYQIVSAGHPPALRYHAGSGTWLVDNARGMALGVERNSDLVSSRGTLGCGEALLFYTDGVIESRDADLDEGLAWLRRTAQREVARGFDRLPRRIIDLVPRGDDDRAVLQLVRSADPARPSRP